MGSRRTRGTPGHDLETHPSPPQGHTGSQGSRTKLKTVRLVRNRAFREWSADAQPKGFPDSISISWPFADAGTAGSARSRQSRAWSRRYSPRERPPDAEAELDRLAIHYPSRLHLSTLATTSFYFLNTRVPPFNDVRARRAVNAAFDRDAFALRRDADSPRPARSCRRTFPPTDPLAPIAPAARRPRYRTTTRQELWHGRHPVTVWVIAQIAEQARYVVSVLNSIGYRHASRR